MFKHKKNKYVFESLYLLAKNNNNKQIVACICQELYIINNLRANLLIGNNHVDVKSIKIDINNKKNTSQNIKQLS